VLNVKRVVLVQAREAVRVARKGPAVSHEGRGMKEPWTILAVVETVVAAQLRQALLELVGEAVVELATTAPQELDPKFPRGFGLRIGTPRLQLEILKEVPGKHERGAFSHADDADAGAAHHADIEVRKP